MGGGTSAVAPSAPMWRTWAPPSGKCACLAARTGTLMISVLLLLWTLAACRGLWGGRYVGLLCFPLTHTHTHTHVVWPIFCHCQQTTRGSRGKRSWSLLTCAFFLSCMNVSCQGTREIKMVVCISCWVADALLAFFFVLIHWLIYLVWGSH